MTFKNFFNYDEVGSAHLYTLSKDGSLQKKDLISAFFSRVMHFFWKNYYELEKRSLVNKIVCHYNDQGPIEFSKTNPLHQKISKLFKDEYPLFSFNEKVENLQSPKNPELSTNVSKIGQLENTISSYKGKIQNEESKNKKLKFELEEKSQQIKTLQLQVGSLSFKKLGENSSKAQSKEVEVNLSDIIENILKTRAKDFFINSNVKVDELKEKIKKYITLHLQQISGDKRDFSSINKLRDDKKTCISDIVENLINKKVLLKTNLFSNVSIEDFFESITDKAWPEFNQSVDKWIEFKPKFKEVVKNYFKSKYNPSFQKDYKNASNEIKTFFDESKKK